MEKLKNGRYVTLRVGERRNSLTFLEELGKNDKGRYLIRCRCVCGNLVDIRKEEFREGGTLSCGCAQRAAIRNLNAKKRHEFGSSSRWTVFKRYARFAKQRNLLFSLTLDQFTELAEKPCFYCGQPPSNRCREKKHYGEFVYSGVDRLNNAIGYTLSNTVPCCIQCNKAKGKLSLDDFAKWLSRVYHHLLA